MRAVEALLASYLDLARHVDPLRFRDEAPPEISHRLGRFDQASLRAQATALRSIANALEDLDDVESLDDEVDRTMLIDTIRGDIARIECGLLNDTSNPALPLKHLTDSLFALMGEDFDAECEAALRERIAGFDGFLSALREDMRPAPEIVVTAARIEAGMFDEMLDEAAERLDDAAVQGGMVAMAEHRAWLEEAARDGGEYGFAEGPMEAALATMVSEPLGVKGTLRLLELRRAGVERSLASAVEELGPSDPMECAQQLIVDSLPSSEVFLDYWEDEWQRVGNEMRELGLPVVDGDVPEPGPDVEDGWSMAAYAVRDHAARMLEAARRANPRPIRRLLEAPGLVDGWGRTVAALLRNTDVFGLPERRVMMSFLALRESAAAEADLMLHARLADPDALMLRLQETAGIADGENRVIMSSIASAPLASLAAALSHEAWQAWYAEADMEPAAFILKALQAGGLAVPMARWALSS